MTIPKNPAEPGDIPPSGRRHDQKQALAKLEFGAVVTELSRRCHFSVSSAEALELRPAMDEWAARELLTVTEEAVEIMLDLPSLTVGGARDIRALVDRAEKGGRLLPAELQDVADTAAAARILRQQVVSSASAATRLPRLVDLASALCVMPQFEEAVRRSIGPAGEVLDTASEQLGKVRREIRIAHQRLFDRLNRMISGGSYSSALQDNLVTTRDGRYVIPVKAEARSQVLGIVHDSSASGQTLFIEPFDVVDLNNRWREAQLDEQHEIDRILDALSAQVGGSAATLLRTVDSLAQLDLAFAKSRLAADWRAVKPELATTVSQEGNTPGSRISLHKARHPLLDPRTVVPIDVEVGNDFRVLLITGPNTGGKTVALKTIGLLAMMAQSGLYITADEGSVTSVFEKVFVDIGDDQSIAQSLSTFSSHITNVIAMLNEVTSDSLVLIDELGTGTDPQEGSAIARAVVADLVERGPIVVATTHYTEVKSYAYERPEIENASVEFDVETLSPTYRLLMGVPGQSNALAIARRLGMPESVLDHAQTFLNPDSVQVDALLSDIQAKRAAAERELAQAAARSSEAELLVERRRAELEEAARQRFAAFDEAQTEADATLAESRRLLRRLQRRVAQPLREPEPDEIEPSQDVARIAEAASQIREKTHAVRTTPVHSTRIEEGDRVHVRSLSQDGEVVRIGLAEADVQLGTLRITRPMEDLQRIGPAAKQPSSPVRLNASSGGHVPYELDIRGMRYAEVEPELDRYIDAAYRSSLPFVRIIHGKGSGALRRSVSEYLRTSPAVSSFEAGKASEGGDGVTVVRFRE
jgi:DNA mismatch repair protein MutS2